MILGIPTPSPTPIAILSLVARPEEPPLLPVVGEEFPAVGAEEEPLEFGIEEVVAFDPPAEPVATPAMSEAVMVDVLVG